jgi:hypothetical protein
MQNHVILIGRDLEQMPSNSVRGFVPGDGDCLLHSVTRQIDAEKQLSVKDLRMKIHAVMDIHRTLFSGMYSLLVPEGDFDEYMERILENEYGDDLCIAALAMYLKRSMQVFRQCIGSPKVIVWEFNPVDRNVKTEPIAIWNLVRNNQGDHFDSLSFEPDERMVRLQIVNLDADIPVLANRHSKKVPGDF